MGLLNSFLNDVAAEFSALNKSATAAKASGDIGGAVDLLYQAKALHGELYQDTRLAKFLQQAGRVDEALVEIQWLIDNSGAWSEFMFGHQPKSVRRCQQAGKISRIHKDAALICKRAGCTDLQKQHEAEWERWGNISKQLRAMADEDMRRKFAEWNQAKGAGRAAMEAFLSKWEKK